MCIIWSYVVFLTNFRTSRLFHFYPTRAFTSGFRFSTALLFGCLRNPNEALSLNRQFFLLKSRRKQLREVSRCGSDPHSRLSLMAASPPPFNSCCRDIACHGERSRHSPSILGTYLDVPMPSRSGAGSPSAIAHFRDPFLLLYAYKLKLFLNSRTQRVLAGALPPQPVSQSLSQQYANEKGVSPFFRYNHTAPTPLDKLAASGPKIAIFCFADDDI